MSRALPSGRESPGLMFSRRWRTPGNQRLFRRQERYLHRGYIENAVFNRDTELKFLSV